MLNLTDAAFLFANYAGTAHPHSWSDHAPTIFQIMPRKMYFGPSKATSIDLCVHDLVQASRFRSKTTILAEEVDDPFHDFAVDCLPSTARNVTFARANHVVRKAYADTPDIIIVQQHLPTAVAIARRLSHAKVILHTHNYQKDYRGGGTVKDFIRRALKKNRYSRLAGIIHVSKACENHFAECWPDLNIPSRVVHNGLNFKEWAPQPWRSEKVLYVGRCAPEKGVLETANALARLLPKYPQWQASFILSAVEAHAQYFQDVREALSSLGAQAEIRVQRPFHEIKAAYEEAAIAVVPSICHESFGRTALEAHAGGAALVSSGAGALAEVSGDTAIMLPAIEAEAIERSVEHLITSPDQRSWMARSGAQRARKRFCIHKQAKRLDDFTMEIHADR